MLSLFATRRRGRFSDRPRRGDFLPPGAVFGPMPKTGGILPGAAAFSNSNFSRYRLKSPKMPFLARFVRYRVNRPGKGKRRVRGQISRFYGHRRKKPPCGGGFGLFAVKMRGNNLGYPRRNRLAACNCGGAYSGGNRKRKVNRYRHAGPVYLAVSVSGPARTGARSSTAVFLLSRHRVTPVS